MERFFSREETAPGSELESASLAFPMLFARPHFLSMHLQALIVSYLGSYTALHRHINIFLIAHRTAPMKALIALSSSVPLARPRGNDGNASSIDGMDLSATPSLRAFQWHELGRFEFMVRWRWRLIERR